MPQPVINAIINHITLEGDIGGYEAALDKKEEIALFYTRAADLLNCSVDNIAYTSNATDSYSRALSSIPLKPGDIILTSKDDYISNFISMISLKNRFGIKMCIYIILSG